MLLITRLIDKIGDYMKKYIIGSFFLIFSLNTAFADGTCQYQLTVNFDPLWINQLDPFLAAPAYLEDRGISIDDPATQNPVVPQYIQTYNSNQHVWSGAGMQTSGSIPCGTYMILFSYQIWGVGTYGGTSEVNITNNSTTINLLYPDDFSNVDNPF